MLCANLKFVHHLKTLLIKLNTSVIDIFLIVFYVVPRTMTMWITQLAYTVAHCVDLKVYLYTGSPCGQNMSVYWVLCGHFLGFCWFLSIAL